MALQQPYSEVEPERTTEEDYFAFEQAHFGRWEYVNGAIRAMAGGTDDHNTIAGNILRELGNALVPRGCRVYGSDMKIHTGDGVNTFPDVAVVCGARQYYRNRPDILTNPLLIVEVLSESTQHYDRTEKFDHYQTIPALVDYVLVASDAPRVLLYSRQPDHWQLRQATGLDSTLFLPSVQVTLTLADLYALITWQADGAAE